MLSSLFYMLIAVVGIIITIMFVIGTHEFAHFITARWLGVKVLRFSIGFGKTLWRRFDKQGTEYVIALIPLGGYVKMLDESEEPVAAHELHRAYNQQAFYKKALIVLAGPTMNLLCAFLLYWAVYCIGFVTVKPIIGFIKPHSIAEQAGLRANQEITSVDFDQTASWTGVIFRLLAHVGNQDQMSIGVISKNHGKEIVSNHFLNLDNWHLDALNPDPLTSVGIVPYEPPMPLDIGIITANSPAAQAGLQVGDRILAVNGQAISSWDDLIKLTKQSPDKTVVFKLKRKNKVIEKPVQLSHQYSILFHKSGYLGISPNVTFPKSMLVNVKYNLIDGMFKAWKEVVDFTYFNLVLFGKIITGKLSVQSLGGPITIFESAGEALNSGFVPFIGFLAFLSASIGVINLFPIPGLDGGHFALQLIETIIRRPIPQRLLAALYFAGLMLIVFVLVQALVNDVLRL